MLDKWITTDTRDLAMVLLSAVVTYVAILVFTRLAGLRSFSKMSAADFAMTVAVGSLFASTVSSANPTLLLGLFALACLYLGQWSLAFLRRRVRWFSRMVDNEPLLLMAGGRFIEENLRKANVTRSDIFAKLREANAINYDQVLAVIFETTGDISVLHSTETDAQVEPDFMQDVVGFEHLKTRPLTASTDLGPES
ncbi:DUF421 domain-containing protein [Allorhodopirellula heiligendammensis]|mgnify:CR=1 FL=1|uniref:YetF C-terminal domain-containing protein n=1 Tax=Allorhodopirellula heiligendammensis TaxID=2714739 RepID=A0A5C6BZK3_9BACT|nr:YetF domain-containing protein [Allorhodopirellula heiligendammensis]TWU16851.1 hypothetical protein Poly21_40580 [Allorhodopirellula heiligendammensis]|tara:strand:+ start:1550 stop:2134 length:585 start_codon:yes stop_codon:yes gene_type:complete